MTRTDNADAGSDAHRRLRASPHGRRGARLAGYVFPLVVGPLVGVAGSFFQVRGPVESVAALAVWVAAVVVSGLLTRSRVGSLVAVFGWLLVTYSLAVGRPEGDVVVAADIGGYLWLYGGLVLGVAAIVPDYGRRPASGAVPARAGVQRPTG